MKREAYRYQECGIDNVCLVNGYEFVDTPRGLGVMIENVEGLHRAIGYHLVNEKKRLNGQEFRFLRHELNLTQSSLGKLVDVSDQSVARWEKGETPVPGGADKVIRMLYTEHIGGNERITEILARLAELDELLDEEMSFFEDTEEGWQLADAA